ncbi:hypothetical protein DVH24_014822 [Malus domestica]|uniref:Uncharacterized protein n=1 Tax=Malus domestica TaxID=3750 RepID=A0A498K752_MALDO|nr:hypothetical protein DVH24_014822 [Malus domestica]
MRMPTYRFSVQTSHLTSMAEEGFDFNACVYNELNFHVNGEAYNINTLNERQKKIVKDLADLGLIKLQQVILL